ncbi:MAG: hypothetical protein H6706_17960 [Myxococcales bacterium]|nr:hypothetical protein [Myxococcales bacterium]
MKRPLALWLTASLALPAAAASLTETLDRRGREAFKAGDYASAAAAFGELLERLPAGDPMRAQTQYNRGRALQEADQPCAAAEALFAYLADPTTDSPREARRKAKAQAAHAEAKTACEARQRPERLQLDLPPDPPAPTQIDERVEPVDDATGGLLLTAGLVTGALLTDEAQRARTMLGVGAGWRRADLIADVEARLSVEDPTADAETAVLLRPGARWLVGEAAFLRAAAPVLLQPVLALGLHGGAGLRLPAEGTVGAVGEAGVTYWLADPSLVAAELRLAVEATF